MSFLDELKQKAGEAYKFFSQNQTPYKAIGTIGNRIQQGAQRIAQPIQPGNAQFRDIARPAIKIGQMFGENTAKAADILSYYTPLPFNKSQAQQDIQAAQSNATILNTQKNKAVEILSKNPNIQNRDALLNIIRQPNFEEPIIQDRYNYTPKQAAGVFGGLALDVATAGTAGKGISKIPKAIQYLAGGAGLGAGYGISEGMKEDKSNVDIAKQAGLYAAGGAVLGAALYGGSKLAQKISKQQQLYDGLKQSPDVKKLIKKTNTDITPQAAQDALDDAALQIQYNYGDDAQTILQQLQQIDVNKYSTWDDLQKGVFDLTDNAGIRDDLMRHITTRRIWSASPDVVEQAAKQSSIEDIADALRPIREDLTGPDIAARPLVEATQKESDQILKGFQRPMFWNQDSREVIKDVIKNSGYEKKTVTWEETQDIASKLGIDAAQLSKKKAETLNGPEMLAIRDIINGNADFVVDAQKKLLDPANPLSKQTAEDLERKIQLAMSQSEDLMDKFLIARSQAGRDLNSLKIIANRSLDPTNWLATARRVSGQERLSDEVQQEVLRLIGEKDRIGLVEYISGLRKSTLGEKGITLWKAGLLTNPTSHLKNVIGNTIMSGLESGKDIPATMADWALGKVTGQRTKAIAPLAKGKASAEGVAKGASLAKKYIKTGIDPDDLLRKWDVPKEVKFNNRVVQGYVDSVFRSLGAEDKVFRYKMIQRSLMEESIVRAKQLVKNGDIEKSALKETIQQLYKNPTDDMARIAIDAADYVTFQSDNVFANMAAGAKRGAGAARPAVEFLMPFTKTPSNVAKTIGDYSPVGIAKELVKQVKKGYNQKQLSEAIGRGITGSTIIALGSALAASGKLTGAPSEDSHERNIQEASGELSRSVKIGDTWTQINQFAPMGNLLILGADLYNTYSKGREEGKSIGAAAQETALQGGLSTIKQVTDQPFLKGVSGGLNALVQPERYGGNFVEQSISSIVPSIIGAVSRGIDPVLRQSNEDSVVGQVIDATKERIPGLSKSVTPQRTMIGTEKTIMGNKPGEPEKRSGLQVMGDILQSLFDPTIRSEETKNPVLQEMKRLNHGVPIPTKDTLTFDGVEGSIALTPETQDRYRQTVGAHYYNLSKEAINSPQWQTLDDEQKKEVLDAIYNESKKLGELYLQSEYLQKKFGNQPN